MEKRFVSATIAALALLASFGLTACGAGGNTSQSPSASNNASQGTAPSTKAGGNAQVAHVTATDFKWTLDKTDFKVNQPIEFVVTDKEGVHGFSIDGTSVNQPLAPGDAKTIAWTPTKPGTYTIRCNIYCGSGHDQMFTKIHVK
ncbi:cupredoxin domain-containing protein [Fodinisporobacter ferrooxydans]|uniref:Cupredoxin domain-containing protein n=1 Tax=Fodinisporobacter ferrooxydans TaxID=2901836 RepID=A0ABY4CP28_9BACL|nr:cupredoxin domain-containing protein [Alicyclobacillaceae bacterium MYW30-H2]